MSSRLGALFSSVKIFIISSIFKLEALNSVEEAAFMNASAADLKEKKMQFIKTAETISIKCF